MERKKIAIITGASSGFGELFTKMMDIQFEKIEEFWIIGRNTDRLVRLSNEMKHKAKIMSCDLTDERELKKIFDKIKQEKPLIKMLINNAGFGIVGHVENQREHDLMQMIDVNCKALTYLSRVCIPYMSKNSRIINIASVAAFMPQPSFAVYAATKAYVLSFTRALNCELKKKGIFATAVCPGPADTQFFHRAEQSGQSEAGFYKKLFMVKPEYVVEKALQDSIMKRDVSVYSIAMKGLHLLTKIVPRRFLFFWLK